LTRVMVARSALDALLAASRDECIPAAPLAAPPLQPVRTAPLLGTQAQLAAVAPEAAGLLARLTACLPMDRDRPPSIQFLPCGARETASQVACRLACAAAVLLGRTLLLNAQPQGAAATGEGQTPLPDAFMPGLYHRPICLFKTGGLAAMASGNLAGLASDMRGFRIVIVDSLPMARDGTALALARLCTGCVLVVHAGLTTHDDVQKAARAVEAAGGHVLGTVLSGAVQKIAAVVRAA
jgi:hypothetical protein